MTMARIGVRKSEAAPRGIPDLDGFAAKLGGGEGDAWCTLCGESGHKATAHAGGKAMVRDCSTAGEPEAGDSESPAHGEATAINKATQFGENESKYTVGGKNYELPGARGEKATFIFG